MQLTVRQQRHSTPIRLFSRLFVIFYLCDKTRFRATVSVLLGPCCPALLNYIGVYVHTVVLLGK